MFDELKTLIRDLIRSTMARFEPIESDVKELKSDLADLKAFRDELKSSGFGDLKSDLDALGGKAKDANDLSGKTYADLHPADPAPQVDPAVTTPTPTTTIAVVPTSADPTPVLTGAGSVTVDPGTTVHVDTDTGVTTTVPHDGSAPTATNAAGASVTPDPSVVADAVAASQAAGVTVASATVVV